MGVQTEASEERELWSGWNDGDNLRRLPGGGRRAGGEIFRTPGTHTQKCKSSLVTGRRIRPGPRVQRGNVADVNRTPGKESYQDEYNRSWKSWKLFEQQDYSVEICSRVINFVLEMDF